MNVPRLEKRGSEHVLTDLHCVCTNMELSPERGGGSSSQEYNTWTLFFLCLSLPGFFFNLGRSTGRERARERNRDTHFVQTDRQTDRQSHEVSSWIANELTETRLPLRRNALSKVIVAAFLRQTSKQLPEKSSVCPLTHALIECALCTVHTGTSAEPTPTTCTTHCTTYCCSTVCVGTCSHGRTIVQYVHVGMRNT